MPRKPSLPAASARKRFFATRRSSRTDLAKSRSISPSRRVDSSWRMRPDPSCGRFRASAHSRSRFGYLNEGEQPAVNDQQQVVGSFVPLALIVGGTFAAQFGDKLEAGLTLKFLQLVSRCTGSCDLPPSPPRTAAIDIGVRYFLTKDSLIAIGASGLNLGLPLQVNDSPQADPLPRRALIGVAVSPKFPQLPKDAHIHAEVDMIKAISIGGPGFLFGGELGWMDQYSARAGYQLNGPIGSGPTFGVGFATANFTSISRRFSLTRELAPESRRSFLSATFSDAPLRCVLPRSSRSSPPEGRR